MTWSPSTIRINVPRGINPGTLILGNKHLSLTLQLFQPLDLLTIALGDNPIPESKVVIAQQYCVCAYGGRQPTEENYGYEPARYESYDGHDYFNGASGMVSDDHLTELQAALDANPTIANLFAIMEAEEVRLMAILTATGQARMFAEMTEGVVSAHAHGD